ncbi:MAG: glycosyltransferase, partial [candidate division Zixibacteria bacterium]|nr:glycosyltransferase [candidate division Zixibacteria bacterium]NIR65185.1 glycosyltransferase [candidate division Zixibacteria bacterium]NIS46917.1 glycosyltransferase [candidate division Zixibacteria bacterium]NIU15061.1 glycosyltransferase [candidate division Zixibacteria bacterium]NIV07110.1 glycosyltransferase [candidate division Zixibacteria bacterium]
MEGLPKTIRRIRRWLRTRLSIGYRSIEHWLSLTNYTYEEWIQDHQLTPRQLNQQRIDSKLLVNKPVISFVTPVFNTQLEALKAMVESVQSQTYPWWELCLADGSSPDSDARKFLQEIDGTDNRIKIVFLKENLGISGNTNKAFELSTGEYIALLDHDDLLEPNMLFEIVSL